MLANVIYAHTHTNMLNGLFQMSHSLFKSWQTLEPHDTHTNTCDGFLYLRSAGPQRIVIDLCRWAVWGFLRTESSLVCHVFPPLAATWSRYSREARQSRPCSLISIFMVKLRFEVCGERWKDKLSQRGEQWGACLQSCIFMQTQRPSAPCSMASSGI